MDYNQRGEKIMRPIQAEVNEYEHRFGNLRKRQFLAFDKLNPVPPIVKKTPDFFLPELEASGVYDIAVMFEHQNLALTGIPRYQIEQEMAQRGVFIESLFNATPAHPTRNSPIHGQDL